MAGAGSPALRLWGRCVRVACPTPTVSQQGHFAAKYSSSLNIFCLLPRALRGYDSGRVRWPHPKAGGSSCPLQTPVARIGKSSSFRRSWQVVRSRRVCRLWQLVQRSCVLRMTARLTNLPTLRTFRESVVTCVVRREHVGLWEPRAASSSLLRPHFSQDSGTTPVIDSFMTPHMSLRLLPS